MKPGVMMASHEGTKARIGKDERFFSWLSVLPSTWESVRVKHGFQVIGSGTTPPSNQEEYYGGEIPWVNTSELRENIVFSTEKTLTGLALDDFSALKTYPKGAVLIAMYGATIGRVGILGIDATVNQAVCVLGEPDKFTERFVYYCLQASRQALIAIATGGGQPNLNAEKIREHKLPCPDLPTQRLIADYLDGETVRIDALVAEKEKMLALLEEKRAALISRAVTRGLDPTAPLKPSGLDWLGDIPAHWDVTHFKYVCDLNPAVNLSKLAEDDEVTFLPMDKIKSGYYIENAEPFSKYNSSYNLFAEGDIVIAKVTPCFENGNIAIVENLQNQVGFGSSEIFVIRPIAAQQRFIFYYLQSDYFKQQGEASMTGAGGLKRVSPEFVRGHFIGLPPVEEQAAIAAFLNQQLLRMHAVAKTVEDTIALLKERRAALITTAVTGQIPLEEMLP